MNKRNMIIQVSVQGDTLTVTQSVNAALAACFDYVSTNPPVTEIIEVDVWDNSVIESSYGFTPTIEDIAKIENWLNEVVE